MRDLQQGMKTVLGLDIGSQFIKYVQLEHTGRDQYRLLSVGMAPSPAKGIASEASIDQEALAATVKKLLKDGGVRQKEANVALPETNVFTRIIQVPPLSERELASAIRWEAEQYIPLPLEEVNMDFSIVGESKDKEGNKKLEILLVAGPKIVIERYQKILDLIGLEVEGMETEIISASRALLPKNLEKPPTVMVINLGANTTDLSILRAGVISFTRSVPTGGVSFTRALAQDFNFSATQAEEYKKAYGLDKSKIEGKVFNSLQPIFSVIVEEIKRAGVFFQNKYPDETISAIILSGGAAKLPGLVTQLAETTGIETQIGNPWTRIVKDPKRFVNLDEEGAVFVVAIGLAMREV
ncbi:MAG: Type IV pilus assembly protein PilM [Candidatus Gottesmanbacteria bacterium GW2011_GWA1_43_11]|uniref:Type IV pilus assembly protein PilM n=1 Tax=Candidatus Gottesmanbacteria bacterium GW2011_GWA1_43_11 TaxID=1618436 RepID=A0A0G1EN90_9BACT|nr:MAG: Type IV pilus assembly protein PilM [Candidatus Gottesmanbacteria bacterium GW2011_GWA1_43_11]